MIQPPRRKERRYNDLMASDSRLLWVIFAVLVALIAVPTLIWRIGEARRPVLEDVRIVTATAADPVFRTGPRRVAEDGGLEIAAALLLSRPGRDDVWLAPVAKLVIDGETVTHTESGEWPEDDRVLRVFWFTIESSFLGGDLSAGNAGKLLEQRSFLAPEMGRKLRARTIPDQHNDDQINLGDDRLEIAGGTIRLYAKVEVAERTDSVAAAQSATSPGADAVDDAGFTVIRMAAALAGPISPTAGELFRLPGFEPEPAADGDWNDVTVEQLGGTFSELVERRFVVSSWTFAAVALTGGLDLDRGALTPLGRVAVDGVLPSRAGRPLLTSSRERTRCSVSAGTLLPLPPTTRTWATAPPFYPSTSNA